MLPRGSGHAYFLWCSMCQPTSASWRSNSCAERISDKQRKLVSFHEIALIYHLDSSIQKSCQMRQRKRVHLQCTYPRLSKRRAKVYCIDLQCLIASRVARSRFYGKLSECPKTQTWPPLAICCRKVGIATVSRKLRRFFDFLSLDLNRRTSHWNSLSRRTSI